MATPLVACSDTPAAFAQLSSALGTDGSCANTLAVVGAEETCLLTTTAFAQTAAQFTGVAWTPPDGVFSTSSSWVIEPAASICGTD